MIFFSSFGQVQRLVVGKAYSSQPDSTSDKVYISIQNDLDYTLRGIKVMHDKQLLLIVPVLKSGKRKHYSFNKKELSGDDVFILNYGTLSDTLRRTDDIHYNIHKLEIAIDPRFSR